MALWVRVCLAALCAALVAAEPASWSRSRGERRLGSARGRLAGHRTRLERHRWRSRRPSVPEVLGGDSREDPAVQLQRWWNQWMNGTQSDQPRPKLPAFVLKQQLASQKGVDQLRRIGPTRAFNNFDIMNDAGAGLYDSADMVRVVALFTELSQNHSCGVPRRSLVRVADVHPSASAMYLPNSVLLRRCSDSSGCCPSDHHSCVSAANVTVRLPLLVTHVAGTEESGIQHLSFVEDTKCECVEAKRRATKECPLNMQVNDASGGTVGPRMGKGRRRRGRKNKSTQQECRCTREFAPRPLPKGRCKCDCFDSNRKCKRQRRGIVHLSESDNRCIVRGACRPPDCKHGKYEKTQGRCPRKRGEWRRQRFVV